MPLDDAPDEADVSRRFLQTQRDDAVKRYRAMRDILGTVNHYLPGGALESEHLNAAMQAIRADVGGKLFDELVTATAATV